VAEELELRMRPLQWCFWCDRPMYGFVQPYIVQTIYGPALTCKACTRTHKEAVASTWDAAMLGGHDRRRLAAARRGVKK
jgi:hypothetical protein